MLKSYQELRALNVEPYCDYREGKDDKGKKIMIPYLNWAKCVDLLHENGAETVYFTPLRTPGGSFVFSCEHPVFTAQGSQDWYYDENGNILHFPVDRYFEEGHREAVFLGETVTKYHRTLTTCLETLLQNGFVLQHVVEPQPPESLRDLPGMQEEWRRPMMLLVSARKAEF